ncbi:MAG: LysM domain-containing protein, partial [Chloroflexi bacterium]|nr:LysM domain-containing protein [Chloroflexota bacterium]
MNVKTMSNPFKKLASRLLIVLLALAILAGTAPLPVRAAAEATCAQKYTVQSGDTLTKIAATYNITVTELANANEIKEPYTLYVGQVLCIPAGATTTTSSASSSSSKSADMTIERKGNTLVIKITNYPKKSVFVVKVKDAFRTYDTWYKMGRVKSDKAGAGKATLKIPKALLDHDEILVCLKNA